jgi:ATP-dependent protease ClpP protease subunit
MKILYLFGDVEPDRQSILCTQLDALQASDEGALLKVCSTGGDADFAFAIIASIQSARVPVHTYGVGTVCSAALDVLAAGDTRGAHPDTIFMTHGAVNAPSPQSRDMGNIRDKAFYREYPAIIENWSWLFGRKHRYHNAQAMQKFGFVDYLSTRPRI